MLGKHFEKHPGEEQKNESRIKQAAAGTIDPEKAQDEQIDPNNTPLADDITESVKSLFQTSKGDEQESAIEEGDTAGRKFNEVHMRELDDQEVEAFHTKQQNELLGA